MTPWMVRNYQVFNRCVPVVSNYGFGYFNGLFHWSIAGEHAQKPKENYRKAALRYMGLSVRKGEHVQFHGLKSVELDQRYNDAMLVHIREQPGMFLHKVLLDSMELYFPTITAPFLAVRTYSLESLAVTCMHLVLWALVILGLRRSYRDVDLFRCRLLLVAGVLCYVIWYVPLITFVGHSLYTYGSFPLLALSASSTIAELVGGPTTPR